MEQIVFHQALAQRHGDADVRWLAQSADFEPHWLPMLAEIAVRFGPRPEGVRCPEAFLCLPLRDRAMVLARVEDLGATDGPPAALGFQFLVVSRAGYEAAGAEAFRILRETAPIWHLRGTLPTATIAPIARLRAVADLRVVLQREESPLLLGACQALLDGSRLAVRRPVPANETFEGIWALLPYRSAAECTFATFAFCNSLEFHVVCLPPGVREEFDFRYLSATQAEHYPEGRYELALQIAVEAGDEPAAHRLLLRRTRTDALRTGIWLLIGMVIAVVGFGIAKMLRQ